MNVTTAILTTASQRAIYKQYIAQGREEQDALRLANGRGYADAAAKKPAATVSRSAPARRAPARRDDCVRGWEHDVE